MWKIIANWNNFFRTYAKLRWLGAKPQTDQTVQRGETTKPTSVLRMSYCFDWWLNCQVQPQKLKSRFPLDRFIFFWNRRWMLVWQVPYSSRNGYGHHNDNSVPRRCWCKWGLLIPRRLLAKSIVLCGNRIRKLHHNAPTPRRFRERAWLPLLP